MTTTVKALLALLGCTPIALSATAQEIEVVDPNTSGIPGEFVRHVQWAPDGKLWVGARSPFWGEGG